MGTSRIINILFLGGAKRVSLANHFIREGMNRNITINIFSYELDSQVPIAAVGKVIVGKKWRDGDLYDDLLRVIKDNSINIILPFVDPAIVVSSKIKGLCPNVFVPVSDIQLSEMMFDKVLSSEWYEDKSISQPRIYHTPAEFNFPIILKPRTGSASKGIFVCKSKDEVPDVDLSQFVIQDYIEQHTEYSVDCYVSQTGIVTSIVPRIRLETAGGEVTKSMTIKDETIIAECYKILHSGKFRGPITIQFIKDNINGKVYVMEINPRFGGGVVTSIGAGSGIINMILDEYDGKLISPNTYWRDNTIMVRYFNEVIFYANSN